MTDALAMSFMSMSNSKKPPAELVVPPIPKLVRSPNVFAVVPALLMPSVDWRYMLFESSVPLARNLNVILGVALELVIVKNTRKFL